MLHLAQERGEADSLLEELLDLSARVEKDPGFSDFLSSPDIDIETRRKSLEKLFRGRYSDLFVDSLQVMNRKGRLDLLCDVAEAYRLVHEDARGRVEVQVSTAVPLNDVLRERLRMAATRHVGKETDLVETLDESLIGGVILRIGDTKYDASIVTKLKGLTEALIERASREIHGGGTYLEQVVTP